MHSTKNLRQLSSTPKFHAHAAIARETARASQHQIAKPGQAGHRLCFASAGDDQARHFRQASSDEGSNGIMAEAKASCYAGCNCDRIFQRPTKLNADRVVVGVDAKTRMA